MLTLIKNPKILGALALCVVLGGIGHFLYKSGYRSAENAYLSELQKANIAYQKKIKRAVSDAEALYMEDKRRTLERAKKAEARLKKSRERANEIETIISDCTNLGDDFTRVFESQCKASGRCTD